MNKKIEFEYQGVNYTLEYNRDAIRYMEGEGLNIDEVQSKPLTMIEILWKGAFFKNHKTEKINKIEEIYKCIPNKTELHNALSQMFYEAYAVLIGDAEEVDDSKNINWKMS